MKIGYVRVSTEDQKTDLQIDALKSVGCEEIYSDKISGTKFNREGLNQALKILRAGDTFIVWKLDRLGRSLKDLVSIIQGLHDKGINFKSLQENIDTTTSSGKLIFHIFASLAEFERDIIKERTNAGLAAARARGRQGGRPKGLSKDASLKAHAAKSLYSEGKLTIRQIAKELQIGTATLYRYIRS